MKKEEAIISIAIGFGIFIILAIVLSLGWGLPVVYYVRGLKGHSFTNWEDREKRDQDRGPINKSSDSSISFWVQEISWGNFSRKEKESMAHKISILGFAGSLRKGSYNKSLLRTALETVPADAEMEIFELEGIPPFNQDLENKPPEKVKEFKARIRAADAIW
jgi:hypothetical protein